MTAAEQATRDEARWRHAHTFGQDRPARGERRTLVVAAITAVFMVVEVAAGHVFGSMALLADGLHMGSHALALGIAAGAYLYARRRAGDPRFSFGTGKVNALAGFTGALLLALVAFAMAWESIERLGAPVAIGFDQAIAVAVVGLLVNGLSVWILGVDHDHDHAGHGHAGHDHAGHHGHAGDHDQAGPHDHADHHDHAGHDHAGHDHAGHDHAGHDHAGHDHAGHDHAGHDHAGHDHAGRDHAGHDRAGHGHGHGSDHNLRAAYLHVVADALTSVLAIVALVAGKWLGVVWLDPVMGVLGALLVARWSWGLLRATSAVLLDHQAPDALRELIRTRLAGPDGDEVVDLHVWEIGPGVHACCATVVTKEPRSPDHYKALIPDGLGVVHVTVEVHRAGLGLAGQL